MTKFKMRSFIVRYFVNEAVHHIVFVRFGVEHCSRRGGRLRGTG